MRYVKQERRLTDLLLKRFVKDHENTADPKVRAAYGRLGGTVGIVTNILLAVIKYIAGVISGSAAIISDSVNNFSDSINSIVTLAGMSAAAKPADREHPYGHGRTEYLTALCIGIAIVYVGISLLVSSVKKVIHPEPVTPSAAVLIVLGISILMKLWLSLFNKKLGKMADSSVLMANSQDSRNDIFATGAAFAGTASAYFTTLPVDAVMGAVVSLYVTYSGFGILRDTIGDLLGRSASDETIGRLKEIVSKDDRILGVHDIMIHDYGPGHSLASCHVEADSRESLVEIHDIIDDAENEVYEQLGILLTIHIDPVDTEDDELVRCRDMIAGFVRTLCENADIHDVRIVHKHTEPLLEFDVIFPYGKEKCSSGYREKIESFLDCNFPDLRYRFEIEYDNR
ncbi:MAG: cation diffusion facilitator family transporter [Oscillospiraceae bacterium]|nr:cation diffusion facilitator family transporter [Oscillospiraceae bacterium]